MTIIGSDFGLSPKYLSCQILTDSLAFDNIRPSTGRMLTKQIDIAFFNIPSNDLKNVFDDQMIFKITEEVSWCIKI